MRVVFKFFCVIFSCIFIVCCIRVLIGAPIVTFSGFLNFLKTAPNVNVTMTTFEMFPYYSEDGLLSGIYRFFNIFIGVGNVLVFAFKGLAQVILYITWFVAFLFV